MSSVKKNIKLSRGAQTEKQKVVMDQHLSFYTYDFLWVIVFSILNIGSNLQWDE